MEKSEQNTVDLTSPLTIYNATEAALAEIKTNYQSLTIAGVDDKDGYKAVAEGLRVVVGLRNKVDKRRMDLKREIDKGSKTILEALAPVENHLKAEKSKIDNEVERIKQQKAEAERLKFVARTQQLFDLGFGYNGVVYTLDRAIYNPEMIRGASDEQWAQHMVANTAIAAEVKAKKDAEAAEAARLKEENERLRKELEARQAVESAKVFVAGNEVKTEPVEVRQQERPISMPVRFEDMAKAKDNGPAPARAPEPSYGDNLYSLGFMDCQAKVLTILNDQSVNKRSAMIELVQNLKP